MVREQCVPRWMGVPSFWDGEIRNITILRELFFYFVSSYSYLIYMMMTFAGRTPTNPVRVCSEPTIAIVITRDKCIRAH